MTNSPWLTFNEACKYARLNPNKVRDLLQSGQIPARKVGKKWIISRHEIDRYLGEPGEKARSFVRRILG